MIFEHRPYGFDSEQLRSFSEKLLKAQFDDQPPERQRETIARVKHLIKSTQRNSYLRRVAGRIYGVSLREIGD